MAIMMMEMMEAISALWFHFGRIRKKIYEDMSAINNVVSKGENAGDDG